MPPTINKIKPWELLLDEENFIMRFPNAEKIAARNIKKYILKITH